MKSTMDRLHQRRTDILKKTSDKTNNNNLRFIGKLINNIMDTAFMDHWLNTQTGRMSQRGDGYVKRTENPRHFALTCGERGREIESRQQ